MLLKNLPVGHRRVQGHSSQATRQGLRNGLPGGFFLIGYRRSMSAVLLNILWLRGSKRYRLPMAQDMMLCLLVTDIPVD